MNTPKRLLFVVNVDWFFISHRLPLALAAKESGYEVHIATEITQHLEELEAYGLIVHKLDLKRGYKNLMEELKGFISLIRVFLQINPDLVHLVTIKPVLYGGIIAKFTGVPALIIAISGLGHVFGAKGIIAVIRRLLVVMLYRFIMSHKRLKVVFQNPTDCARLVGFARLDKNKTVMIKGAGVDLKIYNFMPIPEDIPCVIMASRLIADKGVWQFVEAAHILKNRGIVARFCLVGSINLDNPTSLNENDIEKLKQDKVVEVWGYKTNMAQVIQQATIVTLPSFYNEGLPKILIEAAACGRPIITTNMPGCVEAVEDGITGLIIPPRDSIALADALNKLLKDRTRCISMGTAGRRKAETEFDLTSVVSKHLELYQNA